MSSDAPGAEGRAQRIEALFHELADLPAAEREPRLAAESARDPELVSRVRALLAAAAEAETFFAALPSRIESAQGGDAGSDLRGRRVGAYVIDELIGRGGMGAVYRAHRADDQFEKSVAIKLVPMGLLTASARERFRRERQLLARLEHPNIARLLDGGVLEDGTPYLVMELVEGLSLDRWCDEHRLDVRERVKLLLPVLDAVQHAHQGLILHSDLKPDNVLVSERGEAKLLDFGIARTFDEAASEGTLTRHASPLTPAFASPEQLRGGALTTSSDVYSLGAMAYAVLTGTRPYDVTGKSTAEIERLVAEQPPAAPSAKAPVEHAAALRGDLDTIVLRAMQKEPGRRYASAAALADDLRAHLDGRPIAARRDSASYVFSRFVRRHRAVVSTVAAALVVLLGGAAAWTIQSQRHARELSLALDRAERETRLAKTTARFLQDVFESVDPDRAREGGPTAAELVEQGTRRMHAELATQPDLLIPMARVLASIQAKLRRPDRAIPLIDEALAAYGRMPEVDSLEVASDLETRASYMRSLSPDFLPSDSLLALAMRTRLRHAKDSTGIAPAVLFQAQGAIESGAFTRADTLLRLAGPWLRRSARVDSLTVSGQLSLQSLVAAQLGRAAEAESLARASLLWSERILGPDHSGVAVKRIRLGEALIARQDFAAAIPVLQDASRQLTAIFDDSHRGVLRAEDDLGQAYMGLGRYEEARRHLEHNLEVTNRKYGPENVFTRSAHNTLGLAFALDHRYGDAVRHYERSLAGVETGQRPVIGSEQRVLGNLVGALLSDGQLVKAERWLDIGERILAQMPEPEARERATFELARARLAHARGQWAAAEQGYRRLLDARRAMYPAESEFAKAVEFHLGRFLADRGRGAEAESLLTSALDHYERSLGPDDPLTARARVQLASARLSAGRRPDGEAPLKRGLESLRRRLPEGHPFLREARDVERRFGATAAAAEPGTAAR